MIRKPTKSQLRDAAYGAAIALVIFAVLMVVFGGRP